MERDPEALEEPAAEPAEASEAPESAGAEAAPSEGVSKRLRSILESLLFAAGDPLSLGKLMQVLTGYERRDVVRALAELGEEYLRDARGFRLQQVAGGYQLRTSRANAEFVKALLAQRPVRLSRASLETLAVVAYRQPVTRPEIEAIRGVDVDAVLTTLLDRRLVRVLGRKDVVGRPLLYGTTPEFLETFGLKDLSSLPRLEELGASADALERAARAAEASAPAANEEAPAASAAPAADAGPEAPAASEEPAADAAPAHAEEE
jgi:segregation and condensation protein B